jgi:hypothetical protein
MDSGGINQNTVGNAVWTNATRALTSMSPVGAVSTSLQQALAASATADLTTVAPGFYASFTIGVKSASGTGVVVEMHDGVNFYLVGSAGTAGGTVQNIVVSDQNFGPRVRNTDAAQTGVFSVTQVFWKIS